jgi:hypothetical protein
MALGLTQPVTEMSIRNLPGCKWCLACKADNLTVICELENVVSFMSHNPVGLYRLLQGWLYLFFNACYVNALKTINKIFYVKYINEIIFV